MMLISLLHMTIAARYRVGGFHRATADLPDMRISFMRRPPKRGSRELLFLHGIGTSSSSWSRVAPHLSSKYGVTCIDLPGFGYSRLLGEKRAPTLDRLDAGLSGFATQQMPDRFTIVGHSLGGWLAARFALQYPEKVERLIFVNTAGIDYPNVEEQAALFAVHSHADTLHLLDAMWYSYPWYFRPFVGSVFRELQKRRVLDVIASVRREDFLNPSLPRLSMPVDVIWGKEDGLMRSESVGVIQAAVPHARVHWIERCGHIPQLERPRVLRDTIHEILGTE